MEKPHHSRMIPLWLKPLLDARYYSPCEFHGNLEKPKKTEYNAFCLDCRGNALCTKCRVDHSNHHTIRIFKASNEAAVRVEDIEKYLDTSQIQVYSVNHDPIHFLNKRVQNGNRRRVHVCEVCDRDLPEGIYRFCCISCKLEGVQRGDEGITLINNSTRIHNNELDVYDCIIPKRKACGSNQDDQESTAYKVVDSNNNVLVESEENSNKNNKCPTMRKRPRKAIPVRAPLM